MQARAIKIIAVLLTILVIANLILFVLGIIKSTFFWLTLILVAFFAFYGIPYLKKGKNEKPGNR
jgi:vacuolar-type H+-ATPase subunit I/STV1